MALQANDYVCGEEIHLIAGILAITMNTYTSRQMYISHIAGFLQLCLKQREKSSTSRLWIISLLISIRRLASSTSHNENAHLWPEVL